jgi:hypothetical protein
VFALGKRSERLFDKLRKHWQYAGSIAMIAGPDLSGPVEGKQVSVKKHGLLICRHPKNDLAIPQDEHVSGGHAYLRYEQAGL